jgi:hypothetical protein
MLTAIQTAAEKPIQRLPIPRKEFFERFTRPALEFQHQGFVAGHGRSQFKETIYIICNAVSGEKVPEFNENRSLSPPSRLPPAAPPLLHRSCTTDAELFHGAAQAARTLSVTPTFSCST